MRLSWFVVASAPFLLAAQGPKASPDSGNYVLGPGDQISLAVPALAADFTAKIFRIEANGDVSLPDVGTIHASGHTVAAVQQEIKNQLSAILQTPDVVLTVAEFASQPVSVLGAVNQPGIRQIQGHKTLFEVLSLAGGLRPDAGSTVEVTRDSRIAPLPVSGVKPSAGGQGSVAILKLKDVMNASSENISVLPGDTVFVPKAGVAYAVGSVVKPGGYTIGEDGVLSALQMVALAGGLQRTAATDRAKILRLVPGSPDRRAEIAVDVKHLLSGKTPDVPLLPNDILFIPNSGAKSAGYRTIDAVVAAATGLAVYGNRF